ncbi:MAG: tRNA uridine-5-carboxymethylaminomethyl(34) synthesis GTPase MnmE [Oscillospiraceae bacterium]|nr:tRNA uridine-5-carboxymethylaminomethyl(34) synthesis GTPase MnmE [Oscillospiraceae bacterium]
MTDTIAAVATAPLRSAIGIVRLSGPGSVEAVEAVFQTNSGKKLRDCRPRRLVYGTLRDREGNVIDSALATYARAPRSFTGEDTAELQCHGSPAVLALALEAVCAHGARQAAAGEFTKRAFLNGMLDLTQAEAVIDLIDAETAEAARNAASQLGGALSRRVERIYEGLVDVSAHFCAVLDYPDEDIDPFTARVLEETLSTAEGELQSLLGTYRRGKLLADGIPCAIVGRPNAGKSSLLNALLGYERAIVTPVAGTTRDTVEERLRAGGVLLRLIDTAGLRDTDDTVERAGVERSQAALKSSELALLVLDGSRPLETEDMAAIEAALSASRTICVVNKSDLPCRLELEPLRSRFSHVCPVSALTGEGLAQLEDAIALLFPPGEGELGTLLTNARQEDAARRALAAVRHAAEAMAAGMTPDAVLSDVEQAMEFLGELTGKTVRNDVTNRIFQRFCVGK